MRHPRSPFKWRHFEPAIILLCVRWYCRHQLSYRDLEEMMRERGLSVDHTTAWRWVRQYAPEINKGMRPHLRMSGTSYRLDETYVKVGKEWKYLYRAARLRRPAEALRVLQGERRARLVFAGRQRLPTPALPRRHRARRFARVPHQGTRLPGRHQLRVARPRSAHRHHRPRRARLRGRLHARHQPQHPDDTFEPAVHPPRLGAHRPRAHREGDGLRALRTGLDAVRLFDRAEHG